MCALLWHQVHLYCRATTTTIILCLPKPKPSTHWTVPPHPCFSSPWQPPFCFLSLWISLLWLLYLSGITQYLPFESESESVSFSAVSDCLWPHGLYSPRDSPGQNTGVGCHALLQGIFPTRGSNLHLPYCRQILYRPNHLGNPICPLGSAIFHLTLMFPRFFHVVECLKISFSISNSTVCIHHSFCPFLLQ